MYVRLSVCPSVRLSVMSLCLSIYLYVYVCLFLCIPFFPSFVRFLFFFSEVFFSSTFFESQITDDVSGNTEDNSTCTSHSSGNKKIRRHSHSVGTTNSNEGGKDYSNDNLRKTSSSGLMSLSPPKFSPYSSPLFAKNKNKFALYDENGMQLNNFSTSTSPTKNNEIFEIDSIRRNTVHGIATSKSVILIAENAENLENDRITKRDKKFSGDMSSTFVSLDDDNGKIDIGRNRNNNDKIDNFKNRGNSNQILTPKRRKIVTDKNEDVDKINDNNNDDFIDNYDIYSCNNDNNNNNNNNNNHKNYDSNVNKNLNNDKKNNNNSNNYEINAGIKHDKDDGIHNRNRVRSSAKKAMSKKDLIRLNKSRSSSKTEMNNKHDAIDGNHNDNNSNDSGGNSYLMTMEVEGYSVKLKDSVNDDQLQGGEGQGEGRRGKERGQREEEGDDDDDDDVSSNYSDPKEYQQWRSVHSDLEYEGKSGDDYEVEEDGEEGVDEEEEEDEYEVDFRKKGKALRESSKNLIPHLSYSSLTLYS